MRVENWGSGSGAVELRPRGHEVVGSIPVMGWAYFLFLPFLLCKAILTKMKWKRTE